MQVVRLEIPTGRLETVGRIEGLRPDGWLGVTPSEGIMVHRDASVREVVVMDWEER